ncbi:lysophospholipid acyltransferase family protein [Psychrosphaera sp. B3R10]|nr:MULTISPECIES: lysophospholipid acyltransferase family protein [unclassified Psychrosphaera]MBU2882582.1 lysophospholipid acyltransferase family protein [Psychrosphaera sp. I2R16]MBU2989399.1 lysophospholipid acyltransferase family protein [Psychrosphaera sp. B3R10]MDO6718233.1 lysophospholipid acyltransferase family protein [Psychrosphaera sp. 1_MG-2023]
MISVENVVAENFPAIESGSPFLKNSFLRFLRFIFHESEFQRFEQTYPHLVGVDFVEQALEFFEFGFITKDRELRHIPSTGKVVAIANHPIGSLDGLVLLKMFCNIRRDVKVVANDILWAIKPLRPLLLPVNNMGNKTAKENMKAIENHLVDGGALLIFPAGEVSRMSATGVKDGKWKNGFLRFAKKTQAPILPIHIDGKNSAFFYGLSMLAKPVSTLWLVHEMFKKHDQELRVRIGKPISYATYTNIPVENKQLVKLFKKHLYKLSKKKTLPIFSEQLESMAHPEDRKQLKSALKLSELIGTTSDGKLIYNFTHDSDSSVMRELGRLRELTFRAVGEGTGLRRDIDKYDNIYDHIILWDDEELEIVGSYRMAPTKRVKEFHSHIGLYTDTLFDLSHLTDEIVQRGLELGRSFVQPKYWGKRSLDYLWQGIGAYLAKHPDIRYLLGAVSVSNDLNMEAKTSLIRFYQAYFGSRGPIVYAKTPFLLPTDSGLHFNGDDYQTEFTLLKQKMKDENTSVPTLYKQYSELCDDGGTQFCSYNVDPDFSDCIDGFVLVDIEKMKPQKRKRYLQS